MKVTLVKLTDYPWNPDSRGEMCMGLRARVISGFRAPHTLLVLRECSEEEIAAIIPREIKFTFRVADLQADEEAKTRYDDFYGRGSAEQTLALQQKEV